MKRFFISAFCFLLSVQTWAQVFSNKEVGKRNAELIDSLKKTEYPYLLPILGAKVTKAGFDLPYSAGISAQYFWQQSDLVINNLQVGFNNGPKTNMDQLIQFDKAVATAEAITIRPDVWLLPFLNVYAILGRSSASTDIGFGIWIPDSTNTRKQIVASETKVEFKATTFGFGITPTIGVGGGFIALDMNFAWTDVPQLSAPAQTFIFGPRFGKNFKLKNPEKTLTAWVGGFRVHLNSGTDGSVNLADLFPPGELGSQVQEGIVKVDAAQQQVNAWWAGLTPVEQKNPVNVAKYDAANTVLQKAGNILSSAESAASTISTSTVQYTLDKRPKDMWNFIVGGQFQLNKHWMLRGEYGFLGSRTQVITGLQYRFGL